MKIKMGKKIVIQKPAISPEDKPVIANIPIKNSSDLQNTMVTRAKQIKIIRQPKRLKTMDETWNTVKPKEVGSIRVKGLRVLLYGKFKVGKTHLAQTSIEFTGFKGVKREIPCGFPAYILDTEEESALDIADDKFEKYLIDGSMKIKQCGIRDENNKLDKATSLITLESFTETLLNQEQGTIIIDTLTDYADWLYFVLVTKVLPDRYDFDELWENETEKLLPFQYTWKKMHNVKFLRNLRATKMNVILIAQGKDEYEVEPADPSKNKKMQMSKTGAIIADVDGKTGHWVDITALLEKDQYTGERKLTITNSRFEDSKADYPVLTGNIKFEDIIKAISNKL